MKVFLGCPMGENIIPQTALAILGLVGTSKLGAVSFSQDGYIDRNHNGIVGNALKLGMDAILFVDSDHEFPADSLDRLIARNKDIVGCQYRMRQTPWGLMPPCSLNGNPDELDHGCQEVEWLPSGLMLVRTDVFRKLPFPWFPNLYGKKLEDFVGSDMSFCRKARGLGGYKVWCDFDLSDKVTHITRVSVRRDGTFVHPGTSLDGICEVG